MRQPRTRTDEAEAKALERAAEEAFAAGDYSHHAELVSRAQWVRRTAREKRAGVTGWPAMGGT